MLVSTQRLRIHVRMNFHFSAFSDMSDSYLGLGFGTNNKWKKTSENGLESWKKALNNVMPAVEVKSRRVGGANFQVPTEVRPERKIALGMKWLINYSRKRGEKTMTEKLAGEIISASKGEGAAVKKKEDTHKMAEANKAFSHFRF